MTLDMAISSARIATIRDNAADGFPTMPCDVVTLCRLIEAQRKHLDDAFTTIGGQVERLDAAYRRIKAYEALYGAIEVPESFKAQQH